MLGGGAAGYPPRCRGAGPTRRAPAWSLARAVDSRTTLLCCPAADCTAKLTAWRRPRVRERVESRPCPAMPMARAPASMRCSGVPGGGLQRAACRCMQRARVVQSRVQVEPGRRWLLCSADDLCWAASEWEARGRRLAATRSHAIARTLSNNICFSYVRTAQPAATPSYHHCPAATAAAAQRARRRRSLAARSLQAAAPELSRP